MRGWKRARISARSCWCVSEATPLANSMKLLCLISRLGKLEWGKNRITGAAGDAPRRRNDANVAAMCAGRPSWRAPRARVRLGHQREDRRLRALHVALAAAVLIALPIASPVRALDAVNVRVDIAAIDLTDVVERLQSDGGRIQVSTAPGPDGIVRRIEVPAREV